MTVPDDVRDRAGSLVDRYQVPPFSVLDTRQGYWQEAKRSWLALGIRSEVGRGDAEPDDKRVAAFKVGDTGYFASRGAARDHTVARAQWEDHVDDVGPALRDGPAPGTSVFDPVLCELVYRWFAPPRGVVLDPFAGGSVRGIVASWLGHPYIGVDLSAAQMAANYLQAEAILRPEHEQPLWVVGDSRQVVPVVMAKVEADLVFTCPPYHDLEVYSDDPTDLSAMSWPDFLTAYAAIIEASLAALKRDRFAAIVVSEIRGPGGCYRGLVPWTIRHFEMHGARYYNEAIIVNTAGTLPLRVGRAFDAGRKLGRTHQNLLVFVKGDPPRTHDWGYDRTSAPPPQLSWLDDDFDDL